MNNTKSTNENNAQQTTIQDDTRPSEATRYEITSKPTAHDEPDSERALREENVRSLLFRLAIPAITAQVINALYNMVDRMYIGHIPGIGGTALTGVGVTFPIIMVISAFAALVSMGGAPRAAIQMGKQDHRGAEEIMGCCTAMLVLLSLLLSALIYAGREPLLYLFGASENTFRYGEAYLTIYLCGTIFVQLTLGLNAFITTQGYAKISMMTVIIGAGLNIILDPLFIFALGMGVRGAALATVISQACSALWVLRFLTSKKSGLRLRRCYLRLRPAILLPVMGLGIAPFIMQFTESIIILCFNSSLLRYGGDLAVGAMTILSSVMQFAMLPLSGLTQGAQPIISYNFGAQNIRRVKDAFRILLTSCLIYSTALWLICMLFPQVLAGIFTGDAALIDTVKWALRVYMGTSFLFGAQIACQQTFIALGNAVTSTFLALLRKVILLIPLIFILPNFFTDRVFAVFLAEPVTDLIAVLTTLTLFIHYARKTLR